MKRKLALFLALAMLLVLFAGCSDKPSTGGESTPTDKPATSTAGTSTPAQTAKPDQTQQPTPQSPYNYAPGNYEKDADGFPIEPYDYPLPLTTSEEVLSYYVLCLYPNYIPESGYQDLPVQRAVDGHTGVNIEYIPFTVERAREGYSIMLASDELPDICNALLANAPDSPAGLLENDYIINLFDYRDYIPNYMYYFNTYGEDRDVRSTLMPVKDTMYGMQSLFDRKIWTHGYVIRKDWLNKLGLNLEDIVTIADMEETLSLFQTQLNIANPMLMNSTLDNASVFGCYDTITGIATRALPSPLVMGGGAIKLPYTSQEDLNWMTAVNSWLAKGYLNPGLPGFVFPDSYDKYLYNSEVGLTIMQPYEVKAYEDLTLDPDVEWTGFKNPLLYEGQVTHLGYGSSYLGTGTVSVSATCSNIELALTWLDWQYSPTGSFVLSYGLEGETYEYNEDGEIRLTDMILDNENGMPFSYAMQMFVHNFLVEGGLEIAYRKYAVDGGERFIACHEYWPTVNCDFSMKWPRGVALSDDQRKQVALYQNDCLTFVNENYLLFVVGQKPLSEFQSFADTLNTIGWPEIEAIYQDAYTEYMKG